MRSLVLSVLVRLVLVLALWRKRLRTSLPALVRKVSVLVWRLRNRLPDGASQDSTRRSRRQDSSYRACKANLQALRRRKGLTLTRRMPRFQGD